MSQTNNQYNQQLRSNLKMSVKYPGQPQKYPFNLSQKESESESERESERVRERRTIWNYNLYPSCDKLIQDQNDHEARLAFYTHHKDPSLHNQLQIKTQQSPNLSTANYGNNKTSMAMNINVPIYQTLERVSESSSPASLERDIKLEIQLNESQGAILAPNHDYYIRQVPLTCEKLQSPLLPSSLSKESEGKNEKEREEEREVLFKTKKVEQMQKEEESHPLSTLSNKENAWTIKHLFRGIHLILHQWKDSKRQKTATKQRKEAEKRKRAEIERQFIRQESQPDQLENTMQRTTLYTAFVVVCFLIVIVLGKIIAQNDVDSKRSLYQQQIQEPVGRLDLSKFNLKTEKNFSPPEELTSDSLIKRPKIQKAPPSEPKKILMTAGGVSRTSETLIESRREESSSSSSSIIDKFLRGIDIRLTPTGFGWGRSTSTTPKPYPKNRGEVEWEPRENEELRERQTIRKPPSRSPPSRTSESIIRAEPEKIPPRRKPTQSFEISDKAENPCLNCVKENYLAHYYKRSCKPEWSRQCDCAKYFKCPSKPEKPKLSQMDTIKASVEQDAPCIYNGKVYSINERIPNPDEPCRMCRCRRRQFFNGTVTKTYGEIDCSLYVECPEMVFGVKPKRPTCHFAYRHDQCCGSEVCTDDLPREDVRVKTVCRYGDKIYKWGEMIQPKENSCLKCICDQDWNEHDPTASPSCKARQCSAFLQEAILHKCTPIYRIDGCCPIDFICPEKNELYDREKQESEELESEQEEESSEKNLSSGLKPHTTPDYPPESPQKMESFTNKCILDKISYPLGTKVYIDRRETKHGRTCASCECKVPPQLTCKADFRCTRAD